MHAWRGAYWVTTTEFDDNPSLALRVSLPMGAWIEKLESDSTLSLAVLFCMLVASTPLFTLMSNYIASRLSRIQTVAHNFSTMGDSANTRLPESKIAELSDLADQFRALLVAVKDKQLLTEILEQRSSQSASELAALIDTANAPIFGIDADGLVNEWNQTAERITGFGKDEVLGRDLVAHFITDDYKASVREVLDQALLGQQTANYEFPLYTKTGDRVDVLLNSTTRRDASGEIVGVVGVGQDITELRHSQAQVIQASKLATLGEMATSVAHELNQPLNVIRMASNNCRRHIEQRGPSADYVIAKLDRIESQTERAAAIIDHMRMFGRKAQEKNQPMDARVSVTDALQLVGEQLRLAGIQVITHFPETPAKILGHEIQVEQVILNLITNSRDALDSESTNSKWLSFTVSDEDDVVKIICEDSGPGIAESSLERVFEPFYTTKAMGKGTGLGLSVSYGIIRDMGGQMEVENSSNGARFIIKLPAYHGG